METVILSPSGTKKILGNRFELYKKDIEQSVRGLTPGQWCIFDLGKNPRKFLGYINSNVEENRPCAYIVEESTKTIEPYDFIEDKLNKAIKKREGLFSFGSDARLVYGQADSLPGLIVDSYKNCLFIQINTAGIDIYRDNIKNYFSKIYSNKEILFLDNEKYRKGEMLPVFDQPEPEIKSIQILENELNYEVSFKSKQKIGYYYDHRVNRDRAAQQVKYISNRENLKGLDLFCYVGSWGMNLLKSGISYVDFIDQGDFNTTIDKNLKLNNFENKGRFQRANVFEYLKQNKETKYDVICSDPPAFCKSKKEKRRAIDGYVKLHKLCIDLLNPSSLFLACSCTHYVDHAEFQQTVIQAARLSKRKIQLIDIGIQGFDHPIESTEDTESYLKYYAYYVE